MLAHIITNDSKGDYFTYSIGIKFKEHDIWGKGEHLESFVVVSISLSAKIFLL